MRQWWLAGRINTGAGYEPGREPHTFHIANRCTYIARFPLHRNIFLLRSKMNPCLSWPGCSTFRNISAWEKKVLSALCRVWMVPALPAGLWWSLRTSLLQAKLCTKPCQAALVLELLFQSSPDSLYIIISGAQPRNEETEGLFLAVYSSNLILKKKKRKPQMLLQSLWLE